MDDIALTAVPQPDPVQLTVDATSSIRTLDGRFRGVNLAIWDSNLTGTISGNFLSGIRSGLVRFPGGSTSDDYDWQTDRSVSNGSFQWGVKPGTFAKLAEGVGAQGCVTVNYGSGTPEQAAAWVAYYNADPSSTVSLGTDAKGRDWKTAGYWAALRAAAPLPIDDGLNFLRLSHPVPYHFTYWEVGNECYGGWEYDQHGVAGSSLSGTTHDPYTYAQAFKDFRDRMRSVDPSIRIGAVAVTGEDRYGTGTHAVTNPVTGVQHTGWTPVVLANLASMGAIPDFISHHIYPQNPGAESDALLLQSPAIYADDAANLRKMLSDYLGTSGTGVELALTELNSVSSNPGKQSVSIVNALFLADSLGQLCRTEFTNICWWAFRNGPVTGGNNSPTLYGWRQFGDYGFLATGDPAGAPLNTTYPSYRAAKLLCSWAQTGDSVVSGSSNYPLLAVHAAKHANGDLALLLINKSGTASIPAQIALNQFTPRSSTATMAQYGKAEDLVDADITTGTFDGASSSFSYTFPPYSITVLNLQGPMNYQAWQSLQFSSAEIAQEHTGFAEDFNCDGISNGLAYALGADPHVSADSALPASGLVTTGGKTYLSLSFRKPLDRSDLAYVIQWSSDLVAWYSDPAHVLRVDDGTTENAVFRSAVALDDLARQFLRLSVTK